MNETAASPQPLKRWVVSARAAPKQPMALFCEGVSLTPGAPGDLDKVSPVEYMLISIAGCFALSCRGAMKSRNLPATEVEVIVTGEKAHDPPSRVGRISLVVALGQGTSAADVAAILHDAKQLCTVTNTIFGASSIEVTARR